MSGGFGLASSALSGVGVWRVVVVPTGGFAVESGRYLGGVLGVGRV